MAPPRSKWFTYNPFPAKCEQSMHKLINTSIIALTLAGTGLAVAGSSVDLNVSGSITPSACTPSLSNSGVYDLGKISARDLNADKPTPLPVHNLQLAITCEAPTLLALEPRDNRLGSDYGEVRGTRFGLGLIDGDKKLGYMQLNLDAILADGVKMHAIGSTDSSSWAPASLLSYAFFTSFAATLAFPTTPTPIQQLNADVRITPYIAPTNTLPLAEEAPIDGSVTLTMKYL